MIARLVMGILRECALLNLTLRPHQFVRNDFFIGSLSVRIVRGKYGGFEVIISIVLCVPTVVTVMANSVYISWYIDKGVLIGTVMPMLLLTIGATDNRLVSTASKLKSLPFTRRVRVQWKKFRCALTPRAFRVRNFAFILRPR